MVSSTKGKIYDNLFSTEGTENQETITALRGAAVVFCWLLEFLLSYGINCLGRSIEYFYQWKCTVII